MLFACSSCCNVAIGLRGWSPALNYWNGYGGNAPAGPLLNPTEEWSTVIYETSALNSDWSLDVSVKKTEDAVRVRLTMTAYGGETVAIYEKPFDDFRDTLLRGESMILSSGDIVEFNATPDHEWPSAVTYGTAELGFRLAPSVINYYGKTYAIELSAPEIHTVEITEPDECEDEDKCGPVGGKHGDYVLDGLVNTPHEFTIEGPPSRCWKLLGPPGPAGVLGNAERRFVELYIPGNLYWGFYIEMEGGYRHYSVGIDYGSTEVPYPCDCEVKLQPGESYSPHDDVNPYTWFQAAVAPEAFEVFQQDGVYSSGPIGRGDVASGLFVPGFNPIRIGWRQGEPMPQGFGTVSFTLTQKDQQARQYGRIPLRFRSCFGAGAKGYANIPAFGPISSLVLESGGYGYKAPGRAQPSLYLPGVTTLITYTMVDNYIVDGVTCDNAPVWWIQHIEITGQTTYYDDGTQLVFQPTDGTNTFPVGEVSIATLHVAKSVVQLAVRHHAPAFSVVMAWNTDDTWRIERVDVLQATQEIYDNSPVQFKKQGASDYVSPNAPSNQSGFTTVQPAEAYFRVLRREPLMSVDAAYASGSGAQLLAVVEPETVPEGDRPLWRVAAITVVDGGSGYAVGDSIYVYLDDPNAFDGLVEREPNCVVSEVSESGTILSVEVVDGGTAWVSDGEVETVDVVQGGKFYSGSVVSVTLSQSRPYYANTDALPPITANVEVDVMQPPESSGSGAVITAVVDPNTGGVSELILENAGQNYMGYVYINSCNLGTIPP